MIYTEYLKTEDWQNKRNLKKSKRNRCGICGNLNTQVHHLSYKNLVDVEQTDLRRLCWKCHNLTHKLIKEGKIKFRNDNHNSRWCILKTAVKKELGILHKNMFRNYK